MMERSPLLDDEPSGATDRPAGADEPRPRRDLPASQTAKVDAADGLVTVSDLAKDLGITVRALRFYEDKQLIAPSRLGSTRVYSSRDRARMIIILRGKRLGFSLREIRDFLDLYDADPKGVTQMRALLDRIAERRRHLEDKRQAIDEALAGLAELETVAVAIVAKAGARRDKSQKNPI